MRIIKHPVLVAANTAAVAIAVYVSWPWDWGTALAGFAAGWYAMWMLCPSAEER